MILTSLAIEPARAEINAGYSAEWLAHAAQIVALATPVAAEVIKGPGQVSFIKTRFQIDDPLKGPLTSGDTMTVYDWSFDSDPLKLVQASARKRRMLIFCSISEHNFPEIDGKIIFTEQHSFKSAYFADEPIRAVYTPDFRRIVRVAELVERTRAQVHHERGLLAQYWKGTVEKKSLEIPHDTEASQDLEMGSTCYLYVPEYKPK